MMTMAVEGLDPTVPLRYTVRYSHNHQTPPAVALLSHQVNVYDQKMKNPPQALDKWKIVMNDNRVKGEQGQNVKREPVKPHWVDHFPTFIIWYDGNTYH